MPVLKSTANPSLRRIATAALAMSIAFPAVAGADSSKRFAAVVCVSEGKTPWARKAQGTLVRTTGRNEVVYKFESGEQSFEWRLTTSPQGNTTAIAPGFLMDRFIAEKPDSSDRRQAIEATGEIRETAAADALVLLIGSNCSRAGRR